MLSGIPETEPVTVPALPVHSGSKYHKTIQSVVNPKHTLTVDVYCVIKAFGITCPAQAHAIKKVLMPGSRNKGSFRQDMEEAIDAIRRSIEMNSAD